MSTGNNIKKGAGEVEPDDKKIVAIDEKLEELIGLLSKTHINDEVARYFKQQFNHAVKKANKGHNHPEQYDEVEVLQEDLPPDNRIKRYLQARHISGILFIVIDVIMIIVGIGMLVLPATSLFAMLPIHYFNRDESITLIDLISILIILAGVYFLIREIFPSPKPQE